MPAYTGGLNGKLWIGDVPMQKGWAGDILVYSSGENVFYHVDVGIVKVEEVDFEESILSPTTFTPSKEDYIFVGWRYDEQSNPEVLTVAVMGDDPINLYAVYKKDITLSYDGNFGEDGLGVIDPETKSANYYVSGNYVYPSFELEENRFINENKRFKGWLLNNTGEILAPGDNVQLTESATAYAQWTLAIINLVANGVIDTQYAPDARAISEVKVPAENFEDTWTYGGGFGYLQSDELPSIYYYGNHAHTYGYSDYQGLAYFKGGFDSGDIDTAGYSKLDITPYINIWGPEDYDMWPILRVYGDGTLIKTISNRNPIVSEGTFYRIDEILDGADEDEEGFGHVIFRRIENFAEYKLTFNISSYSTIRIIILIEYQMYAEDEGPGDIWTSIGISNLDFHD